jgi:TetR/AcrR family transcriptional regulator, transcriptional repressor for nem operon
MRYTADYKESARRRLVALGGRHAKQHGFGDSGMAALAAAAGVTTGSLYKHFDGKADLFTALVKAELQRTADLYRGIESGDTAGLAKALAGYLSRSHVDHPGQGCPLPSLTPEIARAEAPVREAFAEGLAQVHAEMTRLSGSPERAWALIAQNVGAVMLARALPDANAQKALLAAVRRAGEALLHDTPAAPERR